jgi:hypothetical protein
MKKFIVIISSFVLFACSQTPPKPVSDNFAKMFPNASKVKWDKEEENEWEAEFKNKKKENSVCFDNAGNWLETEEEINKKDLPERVKNAVNEKYTDYKIEEVSKIETPDFKGFEIAIEKGKEELELQVTADGKITVFKESKEDED